MKTILILGGFGFLGTNIIKFIDSNLSEEYKVIVFDKVAFHPYGVTFNNVVRSYAGNFSDESLINQIFTENQIDTVFHFISTTVPASSFNAEFDIKSNLIPTIKLLDCMIRHKVFDITYISSGGAIYGASGSMKHKESDDVFPISSYGVVKLAIEKYLMQYSQLYGLRPLIIRLSNPYGPWHYSMRQGICNIAIAKAIKSETFEVWGDGEGKKDYIFVKDFVDILFKLLVKNVHSIIINLGSGTSKSINEILRIINGICPKFHWSYIDAAPLDVKDFELDTASLHNIIGDYYFTSIEDGILNTYNWNKINDKA